VQKRFQGKTDLIEAMTEIVKSMTVPEQEDLIRSGTSEWEWYNKMVESESLAEECWLFDGLAGLIRFLDGRKWGNEEGEDDEEEDKEEEAEDQYPMTQIENSVVED